MGARKYEGSGILLNGKEWNPPRSVSTIYFVHGISAKWPDYEELLEPLTGRFQVHAYNQRGHGDSPGSYDLDKAADDLEHIIGSEDKPSAILAHSMGCRTAVEVAKRFEHKGKPLAGIYLMQPYLGDKSVDKPQRFGMRMIEAMLPAMHVIDDALNAVRPLCRFAGFNQRDILQSYANLTRRDDNDCNVLEKTTVGFMLADKDYVLGTNNQSHYFESMERLREFFPYRLGTDHLRPEAPLNWDDSGRVVGLNHCLNLRGMRPFLKIERGKDSLGILAKVYLFFSWAFSKNY